VSDALQIHTGAESHPQDSYLRTDRFPHIWCPECGIGTAMAAFIQALERQSIDTDKVAVVSGIGCSGRVAGYVKMDSFHSTHGRAVPFATGLKLANPELKVVVFSGDGDLTAIGGNHLIHAARRNMDLTVICVNNFTYAMTGGQGGPTTPEQAASSTTPYGAHEYPFNLMALAASSGAVYVARWTVLHVRQLVACLEEALTRRGFRFVEIITPCPTLYTRRNKLGSGLDRMRFYRDNSTIQHGANPLDADIGIDGKMILGTFIDKPRPTFMDNVNAQMGRRLGEKYLAPGPLWEESRAVPSEGYSATEES